MNPICFVGFLAFVGFSIWSLFRYRQTFLPVGYIIGGAMCLLMGVVFA